MSERMTDEEVDKLLSTPIPGGSQARDWFLPHDTDRGLENVRDVVRRMMDMAQAQMEELRRDAVNGAVVREYIAARDAYEDAARPPNSHAPAPRLKHGDPVVLRYRQARAALAARHEGEAIQELADGQEYQQYLEDEDTPRQALRASESDGL